MDLYFINSSDALFMLLKTTLKNTSSSSTFTTSVEKNFSFYLWEIKPIVCQVVVYGRLKKLKIVNKQP